MIPDIGEIIAQIEKELPGFGWLVTNRTDETDSERRYFGHVFLWNPAFKQFVMSFKVYAPSPARALFEAFCAAQAACASGKDETA